MILASAALITGAAQEQAMPEGFAPYRSTLPQLPVSFEHPAGWQVEESVGRNEIYAQVQLYAPASLEQRLRIYLVIRAIPPQARGGRYEGLADIVASYRRGLQLGLHIDHEQAVRILNRPATQCDLSGALSLPWESPHPAPVPVVGQRLFFEKDGTLYELGWLSTPAVAPDVAHCFTHLLQTLTVD